MTTNKAATLNLRIHQDLKEAIEETAVEEHRSVTSFLEKLAMDHPKVKAKLKSKGKSRS